MITPTYPCQRVAQYRHWLIHIPSGTWPTAIDHTTPNSTGTGVYLSMRSENLTALRFIEHTEVCLEFLISLGSHNQNSQSASGTRGGVATEYCTHNANWALFGHVAIVVWLYKLDVKETGHDMS